MLNTVFYLLLSGCPEAAGQCQPLGVPDTPFETVAACETHLIETLNGSAHDWPVVHGICVEGEVGVKVTAPANWPGDATPGTEDTMLTASN